MRGVNLRQLGARRSRPCRNHHDGEGHHEQQEYLAVVVDPEDGQDERRPRERRDGTVQLDQGVEVTLREARETHEQSQRHATDDSQKETGQHAHYGVPDMAGRDRHRERLPVAGSEVVEPALQVARDLAGVPVTGVLSRHEVGDPIRRHERDHLGERLHLEPEQREPLVAHVRVRHANERRERVGRLRQPASGTLLGAGPVPCEDLSARHGDGVDILQAAHLPPLLVLERDQ